MSSDSHVKFDGVEGESSHKDHKGEIEVLGWTWGVENGVGLSGGGSGKGKAEPRRFTFTHLYDKSSPVLAKHCVGGKHFAKSGARDGAERQSGFVVERKGDVRVLYENVIA